MTDLLNLIKQLEAADRPNRELDYYIWAEQENYDVIPGGEINELWAKYRKPPHDICMLGYKTVQGKFTPAEGFVPPIPRYTASIDAARDIVSGWILLHAGEITADGLALVELGNPAERGDQANGIHSHLPIAWCIASLVALHKDRTRPPRNPDELDHQGKAIEGNNWPESD